ncbi:MAG TPA: SDR family oxidoreductase [Candidatus Pacearchaeota archaeon]|nr:SDR family oxidoreductase [Candidatus Pacearchaeota archaeon]
MIVVTGATGHIGSALVRELITQMPKKKQKKIRVFVLPSESLKPLEGLNVDVVYGDVRDYRSLIRAFKGAEIVYHLAGIVTIGSGKTRLLKEVNVKGTINVCNACRDLGIPRLVYVSSIHAFKEPPKGIPIKETKDFSPKNVRGDYAKSKAAATRAVLNSVKRGLNAVIVHPTGVIGPYEYNLSNMGQLVMDFMRKKLLAIVDGSYDFVDVRDVAKGIILAGKKGRKGESYILSGEQITVKSMMKILEAETGIPAPKTVIPKWFAFITGFFSELYYKARKQKPLFTSYSVSTLSSNSLTNSEKAKRELGYKSRSVKQSLIDTVQWMKKHLLKSKENKLEYGKEKD